jgi:hypothetical protein
MRERENPLAHGDARKESVAEMRRGVVHPPRGARCLTSTKVNGASARGCAGSRPGAPHFGACARGRLRHGRMDGGEPMSPPDGARDLERCRAAPRWRRSSLPRWRPSRAWPTTTAGPGCPVRPSSSVPSSRRAGSAAARTRCGSSSRPARGAGARGRRRRGGRSRGRARGRPGRSPATPSPSRVALTCTCMS